MSIPLSPFNPLLEVLSAFNFAFVASNSFLSDLNLKLTGKFDVVRVEMKNIKTQIIESEEYIESARKKHPGSMVLVDRLEDLNKIIERKDKCKTQIKEDMDKLSASAVFQRFSLFGGVYCLIILFLAMFDNALIGYNFDMMLLIFNLFSIIFLIWMNYPQNVKIKPPKYPNKPGTWDVILTFVWGLIVSFLSYLIFEIWQNAKCPIDLTFLLKISILLVPSIHFIYYFIRALLYSKKMGERRLEECKNLSEMINKLAIRTQGNTDVLPD